MIVGRFGGIGHEKWKPESEAGLEKYFETIDTSTTTSNVFTLFNQTILQFATPANIGESTVEELIDRSGLAYAIIFQAAIRAVEQLVRDTTAHAAKVSLDVSVIFAAITLGGSVAPSPYVALVVDSVEGIIQTVVNNYINQPVNAMTAVASNLNDLFSNYIIKPALAGDSVPGLFPKASDAVVTSLLQKPGVNNAGTTSPIPTLTPAAKRRQLGQLFESKYQYYVGMLDTIHTPMRKI